LNWGKEKKRGTKLFPHGEKRGRGPLCRPWAGRRTFSLFGKKEEKKRRKKNPPSILVLETKKKKGKGARALGQLWGVGASGRKGEKGRIPSAKTKKKPKYTSAFNEVKRPPALSASPTRKKGKKGKTKGGVWFCNLQEKEKGEHADCRA